MNVGNYELRNCVASGSTTQIWEVSQAGSPMQLAMKLMLDDARKIAAEKNVLKHEFKIGKMMDHPSFLRFHELEINRDHAFFVMDFFRSPSLKNQILSNRAAIQGTFKKLAEGLALAFQFMHETGWLHRDIKPDNILVNKAGEARIIDFSLSSKVLGGLGKMMAGKQTIKGTRTYIAPETILKKPATQQTDMYSLGVTFFEVLTGQPPFAGDTPNALLKKHLGETPVGPSFYNSNVTKDLDRIILKMMEKNPQKRFDSMQDVASALRNTKCFEVDPLELYQRNAENKKAQDSDSVDKRIDSRADADRTLKGIAAPVAPKKKRRVSEKLLQEEEKRKAAEAAKKNKASGMQPGMMPQGMMQPGMPMPGMMHPGMMQPGMPMPMAGMMPQGMIQPGMPMPGMMQPGMMQPGMMQPGMMQPGIMQPGIMQPGMMPQGMPTQPGYGQPPQSIPQPPPQAPAQAPAQPNPQTAVPQPQTPAQQVPPQSVPAPPPAKADPEEVNTDDLMDLMSQFKIE